MNHARQLHRSGEEKKAILGLQKIAAEIVANNAAQAEEFRGGKTKLMGFFVGQLMKQTKGKANPALANELLMKELNK